MTIRRVVAMVLRAIVTIGLLALVMYVASAEQVFDRLAEADPALLAAALVVSIIQTLSLIWRWQVMTQLLSGIKVAFGPLTLGMGRSMLLSVPLPSTVGGDVVRVVLLTSRLGLAMAARSVICDRVLGLASLVVLVAVLLPFFAFRIDSGVAFAAAAATCAAGLVITVGLVATPRLLAKAPLIGRYAATVGSDLHTVLTAGRTGMFCVALAVINHLLSVPVAYLLAQAVNAPVGFVACLLIIPPTLLISTLPISLGGWGVREGALAAGFALVGGNVSGAVVVSVIMGLLGPVVGAAIELVVPVVQRISDPTRRRV
jgi:glycosyltransferase 2 family protein